MERLDWARQVVRWIHYLRRRERNCGFVADLTLAAEPRHRVFSMRPRPSMAFLSHFAKRRPSKLVLTGSPTVAELAQSASKISPWKPDGTISGSEDGAYNGAWRLEGDRICLTYDPDEDAISKEHQWDCEPLARKGDDLFWSDSVAADDPAEATLLHGNPKNL